MLRPPKLTPLSGPMPRLTADWQFNGPTITTTDAIRAGWWRSHRTILLFANCSDQEIECRLELDPQILQQKKWTKYDSDLRKTKLGELPQTLRFKPYEVFVLE